MIKAVNDGNDPTRPLTVAGDIPYIDGAMDGDGENGRADVTDTNRNIPGRSSASAGGLLSLCGKWSFPWLLSISMVQLGIYLNKLYQDSAAVAVYYDARDVNYCIVSASCLFIPAIIYIVYVVGLYVKRQEETETKEIGTRVVHGLLLVPWQIKGRVEVLHFSAQRVCQRRALSSEEVEEKSSLERQASVLEFFEEFYAGFIQLLLQLYIIIVSLDNNLKSKALPGEIVASALTLFSMMAAVRRKDDGILTGILSVMGWLAMMMSRSLAISLATTALHGWMILACLLHGILMSLWLSTLSLDSYRAAESSDFSFKRKIATFFVVFTVFGLPSLTYWPIMFQFKERKRPFIFLFVMLVENVLFTAAWYFLVEKTELEKYHYVLVGVMVAGFVVGSLFIMLYICCKPKYTDQVVYHDMKVQNAESFGMYFEFCDLTFRLPQTQSLDEKLQKIRAKKEEIS